MIKRIITITQKDDKDQEFEAIDSYIIGTFYKIILSHQKTIEIPIETILRIKTREIWKKPRCCDHTKKKPLKR